MICRVQLMLLKSNIPYRRYIRTGLDDINSNLSGQESEIVAVLSIT